MAVLLAPQPPQRTGWVRIIYAMLKNQREYRDPGEGYYEERACPEHSRRARQRAIKSLQRKAKRLGLKVVPIEAQA